MQDVHCIREADHIDCAVGVAGVVFDQLEDTRTKSLQGFAEEGLPPS